MAEEHFFGFYLRNKLGARFHHRPQTQTGPRLMLACLPGDLHEIGLLLFALEACDHGFQTVLLGANMPLDELPAAVNKTKSEALVLSGVIEPQPERDRGTVTLVGQATFRYRCFSGEVSRRDISTV